MLYYYGLVSDVNAAEAKIVCPFHNDVNPSMIVNMDEGNYFCFGCGETGDALKFVMNVEKKYNNKNELQALREFFIILKSDKCKHIDMNGRVKRKRRSAKDCIAIAADYYFNLPKVNWESDSKGYASEEEIDCCEYMEKRGFYANTLNMSGAKVTFNKQYQLIFPMYDNGKFKGWVCRTTVKAIEKKRKYLYNTGFSRASTIVGKYKGCETVYLVEGYMDMMKMRQNGIMNVGAILGWKITAEQIQKLKDEGVKYIISALDNDECGKKGTEYLKTYFKVVRFSYVRGYKDPGDMEKRDFDIMNNITLYELERRKRKLSNK